jgi:hypothetical protein
LRVASPAFIASTTRFMKRDWRSRLALNSLIAWTPRSDSRKWLACFASWTSVFLGGLAQRPEEGPAQQRVGRHHRQATAVSVTL